MEIQCPLGGSNVAVTGNPPGVICVRGTVAPSDPDAGLQTTIRVRVLPGSVTPPYPPAEPKQPMDVDTAPAGAAWCAPNVPVPGSSPQGLPLTVLAWERVGGGAWGTASAEWFNGGGPDPVSCCTGC